MTRHDEPSTVEATAADWYVRATTRDLSRRERRQLDAWLARDPAHRAAYEEACLAIGGLDLHRDEPAILQYRDEARSARPGRPSAVVAWRWRAAALASVAALGAVLLLLNPPTARRDLGVAAVEQGDTTLLLQTAIGERSTNVLPDGSEVSLNTGSRLRVAYSKDERRIDLLAGEAHFDVAHMPSRPFVVHAASRRVTATGTSFDVRLPEQGTPLQVTLLEGRVLVDEPRQPEQPTELKPGERLVAAPGAAARVERIDPVRASAWREGRLIVENMDLADLVREANRYSQAQLVIGDPSLARLKVGGVFKTGRAIGIADALAVHLPVQVRDEGARVVLLPRS